MSLFEPGPPGQPFALVPKETSPGSWRRQPERDGLESNRFAASAKRQRSRVPDAGRYVSATPQSQIQNRENNPMQSRMGPGSQHSGRLHPGHEMVRRHDPSQPHPALKPRDGVGRKCLSCVASGGPGRVPHQCNAVFGAAFNTATDQARPPEARIGARPGNATRPSFTGEARRKVKAIAKVV